MNNVKNIVQLENISGEDLLQKMNSMEDRIKRMEGTQSNVLERIGEGLKDIKKAYPNQQPKYLTRRETSELLSVSLATLNNWRVKNVLIPKKIGGQVRYLGQDITKVLDSKEQSN